MVEVSVLMPVYNSEKYLSESIESILNQDYTDFEFIIIDDGSTDRSIEIINSYNDPRIKFFSNEENKGISYTRNKCIEVSSGNYLVMLDSDDIALPERIRIQLEFLKKNPDFGMVGSWFEYIDGTGKSTGEIARYLCPSQVIPVALLFNNHFAQSTIMIRKKFLPDVVYRDIYPVSEDYDLWVRIAEKSRVENLHMVLVKYRIHDTNISKQIEKIDLSDKMILKDQLDKLGSFTNEEVDLCFAIARKKTDATNNLIQAVSGILSKIYTLNKEKGKYNEEVLGAFLGSSFRERIISINRYNLNAFMEVQNSAIAMYTYSTLGSKIKFFFKCLKGQLKGR